ncbi:MAG: tRNA pseudouridine(55) synthase TruB [Synergistaceae bacterium]|nr:tRNA pseudouridine(55) synthase TruB [Synergistaceae bacterium]
MLLDGILPVYKELNLRSTDCVSRVRRLLPKGVKIGHAGTLDSTAEGILLLLIGRSTRLADFILSMPKTYKVTINFGVQTSTDDATGDIIATKNADYLTDELIREILPTFLGTKPQIPPSISAVHVDGKRAHNLARLGANFQILPKNVQILHIEQTKKLSDNTAEFLIECKKGTYIRSFARDLGIALGTVAHVSSLVRLTVWKFDSSQAITSKAISDITIQSLENYILPIGALCGFISTCGVEVGRELDIKNGLEIPLTDLKLLSIGQSEIKNKILVIGDNLLSLCNLALKNNIVVASPKCNIVIDD